MDSAVSVATVCSCKFVCLSPPRASIRGTSPRLREGHSPGPPSRPSPTEKVAPGAQSAHQLLPGLLPPTLPVAFFSVQDRENAHASLAPKACTDLFKTWGPHAHPHSPNTHTCVYAPLPVCMAHGLQAPSSSNAPAPFPAPRASWGGQSTSSRPSQVCGAAPALGVLHLSLSEAPPASPGHSGAASPGLRGQGHSHPFHEAGCPGCSSRLSQKDREAAPGHPHWPGRGHGAQDPTSMAPTQRATSAVTEAHRPHQERASGSVCPSGR